MMFFLALSIGLAEPECEVARNMKALEFFLQDESDHNEFCPKLKWEQPSIEVYKKKLKSQLPVECKIQKKGQQYEELYEQLAWIY